MMRALPPSTTESRMIAQIDSILRQHQGRIGIGGAHLQIRHPLIAATANTTVLCSHFLNPVMPLGILLGEALLFLRGERGGKWCRCWPLPLLTGGTVRLFLWRALLLSPLVCFTEQTLHMRLDIQARLERILSRIGCYLGAIEVQLSAPHQSRCLTLLDNLVKETAEHFHPVALTDAGQTRMVWQCLTQILPHIPTNAEAIRRMPHQLPWRRVVPQRTSPIAAVPEDDGINRGTPSTRRGLFHELVHKREIK